jgi:hypothetical protein
MAALRSAVLKPGLMLVLNSHDWAELVEANLQHESLVYMDQRGVSIERWPAE